MTSIRRYLTVRLVGGCAVLWGVCGAGIYLTVRHTLRREFDHTLLASVQALVSMVEEHAHGKLRLNVSSEMLPQFSGQADNYFQLWGGPAGATAARSESLRTGDLPKPALAARRLVFSEFELPHRGAVRAVAVRFLPAADEDDDPPPQRTAGPRREATLIVASRLDKLNDFLAFLGGLLLGSEALVLAGTALVVALAVRRGMAPLALMSERAQAIDADAPGTRFPVGNLPAELLPISMHLNDSLARLEASFQRERQFSGDVAHELRTPVAELRALAEVGLKWPGDAEAAAQSLREALEIALQMESVVTRLLALLRCESGSQAVACESIGLAELLDRCWRPLASEATAKRLAVTFNVPADVRMESDPALLQGIFGNLLSNAVAYTPEGGAVNVSLKDGGESCALVFANTNAELTAEDLPHLFERCWRKDPARHAAAHSGLGLPLARAFAQTLGLRLDATLDAADAVQMRLEIPHGVCRTGATVYPPEPARDGHHPATTDSTPI